MPGRSVSPCPSWRQPASMTGLRPPRFRVQQSVKRPQSIMEGWQLSSRTRPVTRAKKIKSCFAQSSQPHAANRSVSSVLAYGSSNQWHAVPEIAHSQKRECQCCNQRVPIISDEGRKSRPYRFPQRHFHFLPQHCSLSDSKLISRRRSSPEAAVSRRYQIQLRFRQSACLRLPRSAPSCPPGRSDRAFRHMR